MGASAEPSKIARIVSQNVSFICNSPASWVFQDNRNWTKRKLVLKNGVTTLTKPENVEVALELGNSQQLEEFGEADIKMSLVRP